MKIIAGLEPNDMRVINVDLVDTDKVAVVFSGGMDSTLLLYMLLKDKEEKNLQTEINCFTVTQCGTKIHSRNVLGQPEFKGKILHHLDVSSPRSESVKPVINRLLDENWIVYCGSNLVPPEEIYGRPPTRPLENPDNKNLILPFLFLYKYHILDSFRVLNITNILPFTHSCTESVFGRCEYCFACNERTWAFQKLNMMEV